ncbi:hypothetical protein BU14_0022s0074 [Porphyra umbilicalis]|uniref:Uncharacterized protein n=1 Tax=Porphyra umbilicalis TaxID=2786 RepID=A0A1X6PL19_PORUM|nr:hypothetical protein BU14_0022s0074 [Porphyra umbilicalis]|eukprot:OSX81353.1 hypothetical protein BU14_0022s0074 [Porphyra umbilicalis]
MTKRHGQGHATHVNRSVPLPPPQPAPPLWPHPRETQQSQRLGRPPSAPARCPHRREPTPRGGPRTPAASRLRRHPRRCGSPSRCPHPPEPLAPARHTCPRRSPPRRCARGTAPLPRATQPPPPHGAVGPGWRRCQPSRHGHPPPPPPPPRRPAPRVPPRAAASPPGNDDAVPHRRNAEWQHRDTAAQRRDLVPVEQKRGHVEGHMPKGGRRLDAHGARREGGLVGGPAVRRAGRPTATARREGRQRVCDRPVGEVLHPRLRVVAAEAVRRRHVSGRDRHHPGGGDRHGRGGGGWYRRRWAAATIARVGCRLGRPRWREGGEESRAGA